MSWTELIALWLFHLVTLHVMDVRGEPSGKYVPRNCEDWKQTVLNGAGGISNMETLQIDPDGQDGVSPFIVLCDFTKVPAIDILEHDYPLETEVKLFAKMSPKVHFDINYKASMEQIEALIDRSYNCWQYLKYSCLQTVIYDKRMKAHWYSRNGTAMKYWPGPTGGARVGCACGFYRTCIGGQNRTCNCEGNVTTWRSDEGVETRKSALPISALRFFGYQGRGKFTLSSLQCVSSFSQTTGESSISPSFTNEHPDKKSQNTLVDWTTGLNFVECLIALLFGLPTLYLLWKTAIKNYRTADKNERDDKSKIDGLEEDIRCKEECVKILENDIKKLAEDLHKKDKVEEKLARLAQEKEYLREAICKLEREKNESQNETKKFETEKAELQEKVEDLQKQNHKLQIEIVELQRNADSQITRLRSKLESKEMLESFKDQQDKLNRLEEELRSIPRMKRDIEILQEAAYSTKLRADVNERNEKHELAEASTENDDMSGCNVRYRGNTLHKDKRITQGQAQHDFSRGDNYSQQPLDN